MVEVVRMRGHGVAQDDDRAVLAAGLAERASLELREARIVGTPQSRRTRNVGRLVVLLGEQIRLDERRLEARLPLRDRPRALERARRRLAAAGLQLREPEVRQQRQQIAAGLRARRIRTRDGGRQGVGGLVVEPLVLVHLRQRERPARSVGVERDELLRRRLRCRVVLALPLGGREQVERTRFSGRDARHLRQQIARASGARRIVRLQQRRRPLRLDVGAGRVELGELLVRVRGLSPLALALVQLGERGQQRRVAVGGFLERGDGAFGMAEGGLGTRQKARTPRPRPARTRGPGSADRRPSGFRPRACTGATAPGRGRRPCRCHRRDAPSRGARSPGGRRCRRSRRSSHRRRRSPAIVAKMMPRMRCAVTLAGSIFSAACADTVASLSRP